MNVDFDFLRLLIERDAANGMRQYLQDDDEYDESDEEDSDGSDGLFVELPPAIEAELERRRKIKENGPSEGAEEMGVQVRDSFLEGGGRPCPHGGYIDLMEDLGLIPRTDDIVTKDPQYNLDQMYHESESEEEQQAKLRSAEERHSDRVRLLRYREFLKTQKELGLEAPSDFYVPNLEREDCYDNSNDDEDDGNSDSDDDDSNKTGPYYELTESQILKLAQNFTHGFYQYANMERIAMGTARCCETLTKIQDVHKMKPNDIKFKSTVSQSSLHLQMEELKIRYREEGRVLGPPHTMKRMETFKVRKYHTKKIRSFVLKFVECLEQTGLPTASTAELWNSACDLLSEACDADPDVARALLNTNINGCGHVALLLCKKALTYATEAENDSQDSKKTADMWWYVHNSWSGLFVDAMNALYKTPNDKDLIKVRGSQFQDSAEHYEPKDYILVSTFYTENMEPLLMEGIESDIIARKCVVLQVWQSIIRFLSRDAGMRIAKSKKIWKILTQVCRLPEQYHNKTEQSPSITNKRIKKKASHAAFWAVQLLTTLCEMGIDLNDSLSTSLAANRLAVKMVSSGVVPILLEVSESSCRNVMAAAVAGLGQISRVKDCRTLILQHPSGTKLVQNMLTSKNGNVVSPALLLLTHLLWDEEWRLPIKKMQDPPIENIVMKWAAFGLQQNLVRSAEMRQREESLTTEIGHTIASKCSPNIGKTKKLQLEHKLEELTRKRETVLKWTEIDQLEWVPNQIISRCCILLSNLNHLNIAKKMVDAGAIRFAACCIDAPRDDTYLAAAGLVYNLQNNMFRTLPHIFPDPDHLLYVLIMRIEEFAKHDILDKRSAAFMRLARILYRQKEWKPIFTKVARHNNMLKFYIEELIPMDIPTDAVPPFREEEERRPLSARGIKSSGINRSCHEETGKLKRCHACNKMEGKKNELKRCGHCNIVAYCGRECQKKDWKEHKKICKKAS
mmetsp:Transcript_48393/g.94565  ORF Transcript_48393/g.94565 Transcript_48393/m.94565 type:complete len:963 (-) Transcript_48393:88-2976(-)